MQALNLNHAPAISIVDVENVLALRKTREDLQRRLDAIEAALSKSESQLIGLIESGITTDAYSLGVAVTMKRFPAWKEAFIQRCGKAAADAVTESTPAREYKKLVIK